MKKAVIGYFLLLGVFLLAGKGDIYAKSHAQGSHHSCIEKPLASEDLIIDLGLEAFHSTIPVIKASPIGHERPEADNEAAEKEEEENEEKDERERERVTQKNHFSGKNQLDVSWSNLSFDYFKYIPKSLAIRKHHKIFIASAPEKSLNVIHGVFII